jgi:Fur family transcriptional regulator, ferric uptake regulator
MQQYTKLTEQLRSHGYRLTGARVQVTRILCEAPGYLGAYHIYNALKQQGINVGVASIYRVLELLCQLNLVQREEFGSGGEKFRLSQKGHTHQLVCSECGVAKEFGNCGVNPLAKDLEISSGFKIHEHWLRFFGLCPTCQHKQPL